MRNQQEQLRRLEEALLADEHLEEQLSDADLLAQTRTFSLKESCNSYNTDHADVDLEDYSDQVYEGKRHKTIATLLVVFTILLLGGTVFYLLKFLGVI